MITEMCVRHGVSCVYTSKLFFNRFTSSITINFPAADRVEYEAKDRAIRLAHAYATQGKAHSDMMSDLRSANDEAKHARHRFVKSIFDRFDTAFPTSTEFRMNKVSVTFYLDDPTNLASVIEALKGEIVKVTVPRNESEIAFMRANTDKLILDKYFLDQYPYKVTFKPGRDHGYLTEYIGNQFGGEILNDDGNALLDFDRAHYYSGASQPVLYLTHFEDLFLTKIGVQELIDKVQEVVLRDA